jgi:ComEC/Rec2-related protein
VCTNGRKAALIGAILVLIWVLRFFQVESPLPKDWQEGERVRVNLSVLQNPEYDDEYTLIRAGLWRIRLKGYQPVIPGSRVRVMGEVKVEQVLGKVRSVLLIAEELEVIGEDRQCLSCRALIGLDVLRLGSIQILNRVLPVPMASLASGILLGVRAQMPEEFYASLQKTGTMHIVAASGYNVMIVAAMIMKVALHFIKRGGAIVLGIIGIAAYVVLAGVSSSVVRAGIMGSLTLIAYYWGRPAEAKRLLWMAVVIMLLYNPMTLFEIGFQLSVMATLGLLYAEKIIRISMESLTKRLGSVIQGILAEYLYPTLAATIATLPIIWWHFGRISWISPLVNMLVLPVVPIIMLLSALTLVSAGLGGGIVMMAAWVTYVPLAWMVFVIRLFGKL